MSTVTSVSYTEDKLLSGPVVTREDAPLAADTYYRGMPLALPSTATAGGSNTGDGTATILSGKPSVDFKVVMTAALVAKIVVGTTDIITGIALTDGGTTIISYDGCVVAITDGSTAFVADDEFTIAQGTAYEYTATEPEAIYSGETRTLASAGVGSAIIGGQIDGSGLVDGSNAALTVTEGMKQIAKANGIYIK